MPNQPELYCEPDTLEKEAWCEFLRRYPAHCFATLTFRREKHFVDKAANLVVISRTGSRGSIHPEAADKAFRDLVSCVNRAGVEVSDTVISQLAAAESVLTSDEKELGVALVDIGGGTADLAIFEKGSLWHTAVVAVGGDHFTNDIAVGLRTPIPEAEKIKRRVGCALSAMVEEDETIEVASVGGRRPRVMARRLLSDILQPRAEEVFHLVWDEISKSGHEKSLNSGLVLTGGGAVLEGMSEIAEQIFDLPIRRGIPAGVGGLADHVGNPSYSTAVGLVRYAVRHRNPGGETTGGGALTKVMGRLRMVFKEFF